MVIKIGRLGWLGHLCRMQEVGPCRKFTVLKPEGNRRVGTPKLRWMGQLRKIWRIWAWGTGELCSRTGKSGGQFWKRLRFTKDCNI